MASASDNFERATGLGSNWENGRGAYFPMQIYQDSDLIAEIGSNAANACTWIANSFTDDQYSKGVIAYLPPVDTLNYYQIHCRMQPTTSQCYLAVARPNIDASSSREVWLEYNSGTGTFVTLASKVLSGYFQVGDTLEIQAEGQTLRLLYNGVVELTHEETTYNLTSGDVAIGVSRGPGGDHLDSRWESWEGGDLTLPTTIVEVPTGPLR